MMPSSLLEPMVRVNHMDSRSKDVTANSSFEG
jgi:hypothetical protein